MTYQGWWSINAPVSIKQVLLDVADDGLAQLNGRGHIQHITFHQHNVGGFDRYICSRSDGDTHIGPGQRGSIVDAVPNHRHLFAAVLQAAYFLFLVLGEHFGHYPV